MVTESEFVYYTGYSFNEFDLYPETRMQSVPAESTTAQGSPNALYQTLADELLVDLKFSTEE